MNTRLMPDQTAHIRIAGPPPASPPLVPQTMRLSHLLDPSVCAANRRRLMPATITPVLELPVSPAPRRSPRLTTAAPGLNPHSARCTTCDHSRDFVPWRFSDAGTARAEDRHSGVRETCTRPNSCSATSGALDKMWNIL